MVNFTQPQRLATTRGAAGSLRRPGGHSRYSTQLHEKQNLKEIYGISEEQLRHYYRQAQRLTIETGRALIALLESRLDNAVFRGGFAITRRQARQMTSHRLFIVNERPVTIPSLSLSVDDFVQVRVSKRNKSYFTNFAKRMQHAQPPLWIALDIDQFGFKVVGIPTTEEAAIGVDMQAIVELLAR